MDSEAVTITIERLQQVAPAAHRQLMSLERLDRVVEVQQKGDRFSAVAVFAGDGEPEAEVTLWYGPDTAMEWLEF